MRLLIAGWQGQIASALVALVPKRDDVSSFAVGRPALDLCELPTLQRALSDAQPDVIVNAAAYTAVDKAQSDAEAAFALNRDGARMLAETAAEAEVPIIHLSTDYVFDGQLDRAYKEDDDTTPQTVYGQSKLEGEKAVARVNPRHIILRTSWVYSAVGTNFVRSMVDKAARQDTIDVVSDQLGTPTYAPHLASTLIDVAARICGRAANDPVWGVYHAAGTGEASWFDLGNRVMREAMDYNLAVAKINPIGLADYATVAPRLRNARLDCSKLDAQFDLRLPAWHDGVRDCVKHIAMADANS